MSITTGYVSDADGLPWERIPGTDRWRRPDPCPPGVPDVDLPGAYLAAELGPLHPVPDDGIDPWGAA